MTFGTFIRWAGFWLGEVAGAVALFGLIGMGFVAAGIMGGPL